MTIDSVTSLHLMYSDAAIRPPRRATRVSSGIGLPDVRQKEDMSSFLKSCPLSGRHWLYMEKCPAFLSHWLAHIVGCNGTCVYRFNRKLAFSEKIWNIIDYSYTVAVDFLSIYPVGLLSYFVTCSLQVLFDLLQVLFDYLNLNKRQMENLTLTRRLLFCPPL